MRWLAVMILLGGCGHAPPPPVHAEIPVDSAAVLKGHWVFTTEVDWTYFLAIEPDGKLHVTVDRGKMGRCEQQGILKPAARQKFHIVLDRNTCNHEYAGAELEVTIGAFNGDELVMAIAGPGIDEHEHYKRDTSSPAQ